MTEPSPKLTSAKRRTGRRRGRSRRHGITLVEVLATIVLMGIVLPVAIQAITQCTTSAALARQRSEAASLAEAKLNEMLADPLRDFSASSGDFGPASPEYHWTLMGGQWSDPTMQLLQVRVFWTSRGRERDVIVSTLVYQSQSTSL
jgi:type II secretory pathway pseudopilin PulG